MLYERVLEWDKEIEDKAMQKGSEQAERKERLSFLNALLTKKWGAVPSAAQKKIEVASNDMLKHWFELALNDEPLTELT